MARPSVTAQEARRRTVRVIEKIRNKENIVQADRNVLTYWRNNLIGFAMKAEDKKIQETFSTLLTDRALVAEVERCIEILEGKRKENARRLVPETKEETLMARNLLDRILKGSASTIAVNEVSKILRGEPSGNSPRFVENMQKVLSEPGIAGAVRKAITKHHLTKLRQATKRPIQPKPMRRRRR